MTYDIDFFQRIMVTILRAMPLTLLIALLSCFGAAFIGFLLETLRRTGRWQGYILGFVIDALRSTPILVQIYFLYFVLPYYGLVLPGPVIGVLAMSLYYSSYLAEVFKAGIDAVPRGQTEAGHGHRPVAPRCHPAHRRTTDAAQHRSPDGQLLRVDPEIDALPGRHRCVRDDGHDARNRLGYLPLR